MDTLMMWQLVVLLITSFMIWKSLKIISVDATVKGTILFSIPGAQIVPPEATLLGSPLGNVTSIDDALLDKFTALQRMGACFKYLAAHDSLVVLHHSFALPRLHYPLRTAPCFLSNVLTKYDDTLRETLSIVTNTRLAAEDPAWIQATLPVKLGGLGIRSAVQIAPSAYLASVATSAELVSAISTDSHCSFSSLN